MKQSLPQLEAAIAALEAQRSVLGAGVVDTALQALREQLAAARPKPGPAPQLKQVSVLFVDVVGSTAIGQGLSPEDIGAVMDGALARFTAIVQFHGGRVLQYAGDGMLAAFGADRAQEDDVESAVHAGLAIVEDARRAAPDLRKDLGLPDFAVRAGIHTGRVLLGAGVDAGGSIRGSAVNLAARMEQTAPPGRLHISQEAWRHVSGLFDATEQAPVTVKGVAAPVRGWLVDRAKPRAFRVPTRGIEGVATPMVGRDAERASLLAAFDTVAGERSLRVLTVAGEAGLGKSRLIAEFQQALDNSPLPCWMLLGRSQPRSAAQPYRLLRDVLTWQLEISDQDSAAAARDKLVGGVSALFAAEGEAPVHLLGHLIGLDFSASPHVQGVLGDEDALRERGFAAAALLLHKLAASRGCTLVMLLDDVHWADAGSLDFVQHLLSRHRDLPLLCVLVTRPALFETDARWLACDQRIDLRPLDRSDSQRLADLLLQRLTDVPDALRTLLSADAEGNPFYMEELVKMLIDDGVIVADDVGWHVRADRLVVAHVPQTLTGVLQARLDALAPAERLTLQQAAIVGAQFLEAALAAIDTAASGALPSLLRKQLVRRAAQVFGDAREYVFSHHLLHQVTYDSVLRDARLAAHGRVAAFWCRRAEVAGTEQVDPAACRALTEAHEHGRIADPKAFVTWFDTQFPAYYGAYAGRVLRPLAQSVVEMAEQHCGVDDAATARALTNLARVTVQQSDAGAAEPLLRRALDIQQRVLGDAHPHTALTTAVLGGYFQARGDLKSAEPCFRRAFEIRERALGPDHPLTLNALELLAHAVNERGGFDEAESLCRRVLKAREQSLGAESPETANAMTTLAEVLARKGDSAAAEPLLRQALAVQQRRLGADHPDIGFTMWHLAEALRAQGRAAEAEPLSRQTLELWEAGMGTEHEWTAWGLISLAEVRLALDDAGEAATLAERALKIYERLFGAEHAQVGITLEILVRALHKQGDARAEGLARRASAIRRSGSLKSETA